MPPEPATAPTATRWSKWRHGHATDYDLGVEEEVMLLDPAGGWALAPEIDEVLAAWPEATRDSVSSETHASAVELRTGVHAATAGVYPSAVWHEMQVSSRERHQEIYGSMREFARREPTFALHVHVGLPSGEAGIAAFNRLRAHIRGRAVPLREIASELMTACAPHAAVLGCGAQLAGLPGLLADPGPARQRALAERDGLEGLVADLALDFSAPFGPVQDSA